MKNNYPDMILLGILIPHYNDKRIFNLLDKINESNFRKNIKLFIQDAGSDLDILKKINLRLNTNDCLVVEKDKGIFDGFNKLIKLVNTRYVTWLGADDYIDNDFNFEAIYKLMSSDIDYIQCKLIYFDSTNSLSRVVNPYSINYNKALLGVPFYHIGSVLKSSIVKKYSFSLKYPTAADFHFYLEMLKQEKIKSIPCYDSFVYIAEGGESGKNFAARLNGLFQMLQFYKGFKVFIIPLFIIIRYSYKLKSILNKNARKYSR